LLPTLSIVARINDVQYRALVDAFTAAPARYSEAARAAAVTPAVAKTGWEDGWPKQGFRPIRLEVQAIQEASRAELARIEQEKRRAREDESTRARADAVQARAQEFATVKQARGMASLLINQATRLVSDLDRLGATMRDRIELEANKAEQWAKYEDALLNGEADVKPPLVVAPMKLGETMQFFKAANELLNKTTATVRGVMELERLHFGEPTNIIKEVGSSQSDIDVNEAKIRIASAAKALERAEGKTTLRVVEGGKAAPTFGVRVDTV
jgi:hypothetical protein